MVHTISIVRTLLRLFSTKKKEERRKGTILYLLKDSDYSVLMLYDFIILFAIGFGTAKSSAEKWR